MKIQKKADLLIGLRHTLTKNKININKADARVYLPSYPPVIMRSTAGRRYNNRRES